MRALIFTLLFLFCAPLALAQEFNAGIVQGLWYAQEHVFAQKPTRIYIAIRNNTGSDLSGTVEFFDGDRKIGRKNVEALDGRIIESWTDWVPSYGTHTLKATLTRIELDTVGGETKEVEVVSALAQDEVFADYDTDNDSIGNDTDPDDDGDGVSDVQEKENGTDPLIKNEAVTPEDEEEQEQEENNEDDTSASVSADQSHAPQGIERYLTESPAENVLSSLTTFINDAKEDVDAYREKRTEQKETKTTETVTVDENGFGEVSRATSTDGKPLKQLSLSDFFSSVFSLALSLFNAVYTFILFILSGILSHPILVQVGVLLLILFLIMKFASKFGKRPKVKKF